MSFLGITHTHTHTHSYSPSIILITNGHMSAALRGTPLLPMIARSHHFSGNSITELISDLEM